MEQEEKKRQSVINRIIWLLCIITLCGSLAGVLRAGYTADKSGELAVMEYDRESGSIVPGEKLSKDITLWFWFGAGSGIVLFAYTVFREASIGRKIAGGIMALLLLFANIQINGILASFAFVDMGVGMMPRCELSEEGGGEFVRATHKIESTVAVYFILNDKAYRVDGYDPNETTRTYAARQETDIPLNPWTIFVYEQGDDDPWTVLVYEDNETYRYYKNNLEE